MRLIQLANRNGASIIGPNCPGLTGPLVKVKMGIMPVTSFAPGNVALFSRSGTLMYEIAGQLTKGGFGQSVALGIGGDPVNGTSASECLDFVEGLEDTKAVVVVGEIGGDAEERLATTYRSQAEGSLSSHTLQKGTPLRRRSWAMRVRSSTATTGPRNRRSGPCQQRASAWR